MRTKSTWSNCVMSAGYYCLRGNASRIHLVRAKHSMVPAHVVVENKQGNIVHFVPFWFEGRQVHQNPLYFNGSFEGIKRSAAEKLLIERPILCSLKIWQFFLLAFLIYLVLFIPFTFFNVVSMNFSVFVDSFRLVKRRYKKIKNNKRLKNISNNE